MVGLLALVVSVLAFFRRLWTIVVALVISKEKPIVSAQDIESGMPASTVPFAEDKGA
jgi:hypothetical protein